MTVALLVAATLLYGSNLALGALVQTRVVDTTRVRWLHHTLFFLVAASAALAVLGGIATRTWGVLVLLPALAGWCAMPRAPGGTPRHRVIALGVMPCYALAVVLVVV